MNSKKTIKKKEKADKILAQSKLNYRNVYIILIGLSIFGLLLYINLQKPEEIVYERQKNKAFIFVFSLFALYCIYYILSLKNLIIYKDRFIVKNLFSSKTYYFKDIISYWQEDKKNKYTAWSEYILVLNDKQTLKLIDSEYTNFYSFIGFITRHIQMDDDINYSKQKPKYLIAPIILLLFSIITFYGFYYMVNEKEIENEDLKFFTTTLNGDIKEISGRKGKKSLEFKSADFPTFTFRVDNSIYDYTSNEVFIDFKPNDEITIGIEPDVFNKKIIKTDTLSFWDKYSFYKTIKVNQIRNNQNENYVNLHRYNQRHNNWFNYVLLGLIFIFGLTFLSTAIYLIYMYFSKNIEIK